MRASLFAVPLLAICSASSAAGESGQAGAWTYVHEPSSTGKGGIVTALSPARGADFNDPTQLVARCLGGRTEFSVGGAGSWGTPRRKLEVTTSIDGGLPETSAWDVSTNGKAAFLDGDVAAFLKRLPDDGKLRVSLRDATGEMRENVFSTKGFGVVRAMIAKACGWDG